jgi:hypothetical protein
VLILSALSIALLIACAEQKLVTISYKAFDKEIVIDSGFKKYTDIMDEIARKHSIEVKIQESFRKEGEEVTNAVVQPITTSNHLVGHAIDVNLYYNNTLYNSKDLNEYKELPDAIKDFIRECKQKGIRWGGDFIEPNGVHFDDNLYERNRKEYELLYKRYQK